VVIIRTGANDLEFATIWRSYGSEGNNVEMLPQIAPLEDEEVSHKLQRAFTRCGIGQTYENRKIPLPANGKALVSVNLLDL